MRFHAERLLSAGFMANLHMGKLRHIGWFEVGRYKGIIATIGEKGGGCRYRARIAQAIAGARFSLLRDCGHFSFLEYPEEVHKEIVGFFQTS
jgi:hypothetical protein